MKRIPLILMIFLLVISIISAIRINEVEMNPSGVDSGNEWIELYNKGDIDLDGYKIVNNDGDEIKLSGSFSKYYVYFFDKQWLDNTDEKVFLYEGSEIIDKTDLIDDEENDGNTWQFCDGDWEFVDESEDGKNDCPKEEDKESDDDMNDNIKTVVDNEEEIQELGSSFEEPEIIVLNSLNSKDIKREDNKKSLDKSDYAFYGFIIFCILLIILFVIRKKTYNKNEFE